MGTAAINFKDTFMSPKKVLEKGRAHCFEGALFAAAALRFHGHKPLLVDLRAVEEDDDHTLAVFRQNGHWGAITKTNHAILRYRDPVYKSIRELAMSYFNEYFLENGKKNLRSYSEPVDLSIFDKFNWMTTGKSLEFIAEYMDKAPHRRILTKKMIANLRKTDPIEIKSLELTEWGKKKRKIKNNF